MTRAEERRSEEAEGATRRGREDKNMEGERRSKRRGEEGEETMI